MCLFFQDPPVPIPSSQSQSKVQVQESHSQNKVTAAPGEVDSRHEQ